MLLLQLKWIFWGGGMGGISDRHPSPCLLSLQDSDRNRSGHPPDVPGRAGLSEQRRVTCWIKLEHDGINSSQKETGVIFVCCTFPPLFHSTIKKKKSFWNKITTVFIPVYCERYYCITHDVVCVFTTDVPYINMCTLLM